MAAGPIALALLLASAPRPAAEILPEVSVHLRAARYIPPRTDFHWEGWIGAGAGLARVGGATSYFTADIETVVGDTLRVFEANQANYHLEAGIRQRIGNVDATVFFNHVSRHYVDRPKTQAVDWNILGGRIAWPVRPGPHPLRVAVSVGHTTVTSLVGYRWEGIAKVDAEPARIGSAALFARLDVRVVSVEPDPALDRGGFADVTLEGGIRWSRGGRTLDLFAGGERRNDVYVEEPGHQDRGLFGFRISYLR